MFFNKYLLITYCGGSIVLGHILGCQGHTNEHTRHGPCLMEHMSKQERKKSKPAHKNNSSWNDAENKIKDLEAMSLCAKASTSLRRRYYRLVLKTAKKRVKYSTGEKSASGRGNYMFKGPRNERMWPVARTERNWHSLSPKQEGESNTG